MRLQNPFAALDTAGLDSQVLSVIARADQYLSVQQIHQLLPEHGSLEGVRLTVNRLKVQGTVSEATTGRSRAYALNREHILAGPILQISRAKQELITRLQQAISEWQYQPCTVKLFGSAARNEMNAQSDLDILVIVPDEASSGEVDEEIGQLAAQAYRWTGNDVRPLVYRAAEVGEASIFDSILREGIDIAGDPNWLRRRLRDESRPV